MGGAIVAGLVVPLQPLGVAVVPGGRRHGVGEHRTGGRRRKNQTGSEGDGILSVRGRQRGGCKTANLSRSLITEEKLKTYFIQTDEAIRVT